MTRESLHFTHNPQHRWHVSPHTLHITLNIDHAWVPILYRYPSTFVNCESELHITDNLQCLLHMSPWQTWSSVSVTHRSLHFTHNPQCLWHGSPYTLTNNSQCLWHGSPYTLTNNSQCLLHMSPWQTWPSICVTRESIHFFRHGRQCLWTVRC